MSGTGISVYERWLHKWSNSVTIKAVSKFLQTWSKTHMHTRHSWKSAWAVLSGLSYCGREVINLMRAQQIALISPVNTGYTTVRNWWRGSKLSLLRVKFYADQTLLVVTVEYWEEDPEAWAGKDTDGSWNHQITVLLLGLNLKQYSSVTGEANRIENTWGRRNTELITRI